MPRPCSVAAPLRSPAPAGLRLGRQATFVLLGCLLLPLLPAAGQAPPPTPLELVKAMVHNEEVARNTRAYYSYTSLERSTRTGGHLWKEKVVETPDGVMRRLVEEDGKPLSADRAAAEDRRIAYLAANPEAFRAANEDRRADEARLGRLLQILPRAFILSPAGEQDGCLRIAYRPNPSYLPATYEERIVHGMAGTFAIQSAGTRLCGIDGHLAERISFGYGLLGHVEKGSGFNITRIPLSQTDWKTSHITVHMDGKILMLKTISRDQETVRLEMHAMPANPSLGQLAALTRP